MRLFTIRNKILLVILGVLLSSGIIIITIWYKVSSDTADMYLRDISESTMRDACHAFEYLLTDTNYMATMISINKANIVEPVEAMWDKELLENGQWNQQYLDNKRIIQKFISNFSEYKYYIVGISIVINEDCTFSASHLMDGQTGIYESIQKLDKEEVKRRTVMLNPIHVEGGKSTVSSDYVVPAVRGIMDWEQNLIGYTVLYFDYGVIEKMFSANLPEGSLFQVTNDNDFIIFSNCGEELLNISMPQSGYIYNTFDAPQVGWKFTMAIPSDYYIADIRRTAVITGGLMVAIFVFAGIVAAIIISRMTTEISKLRNSMNEVASGKLDTCYRVKSSDEIGEMGKTFNYMVVQIGDLMKRIAREEKQKRSIEMDFLQAQINPHFISNVLNNVVWMAKMQHADNIATLTTSLNRLLQRAMHQERDMILLREEVEYLDNYITILEYSGNYDFVIEKEIAEDTKQLYVPRFILQPILENAIYHGLPDSLEQQGIIRIITCRSEEKLIITIQDNGAGMTKEQIRQIFETKNRGRKNFNGIGIWNVNERIHLVLGDAYGLHYESVEGKGTRAVFELPAVCRIEEDS